MKKYFLTLAALLVFSFATIVSADTLTFQPTQTINGQTRTDLNDLDHHRAYAWRMDGVNLRGQNITGASLTFRNIRNWDSRVNMLFVHLLDSAKVAGVSSFVDDTRNRANLTDAQLQAGIIDDFANTRYHNRSDWLIASNTADALLFQRSFGTTGQNFVYNFSAAQLQTLFTFISNNGSFALGFDPDCHFFNDGITLNITTANAPVPEPATMALLGTGLAGLYYRRRRQKQKEQAAA